MEKTLTVYVCNFCKKEMASPAVYTTDVQYYGSSEIHLGKKKVFFVGDQHYCHLGCLFGDIERVLT